ncbi:MAG: hypothetical protein WKH64_11740 [Chloroflexia bacterium]
MTPQEWEQYRRRAADAWKAVLEPQVPLIWVSADSGALAAGAADTLREVERVVAQQGWNAQVRRPAPSAQRGSSRWWTYTCRGGPESRTAT